MRFSQLAWLAIGLLGCSACASCRGKTVDPTNENEGRGKLTSPMDEQLTRKYRACSVDADCVLALNGCCDCANGGEDIAVSGARAAAFQASFACSRACTEMGGDCGRGTVQCENQICTYRERPTD